MSIEDFEHIEKTYPEQDVFIQCKGNILFEDFEHSIRSALLADNFLQEVSNAVNDFEKPENRGLLENILLNNAYKKSFSDVLMHIDTKFYLPGHFVMSYLKILNSCIQSSVAANIKLSVGNTGNEIKIINIEKIKTDQRKEVQCTGKLVFQRNSKCLASYENLAFRSENGFFKYPNTASPDIFIMNSTDLHLRGHCFVAEDVIDKNIAEIKKAFQSSIYGTVAVKINSKEQVFKKEQNRYFSKIRKTYYW